MEEYETKENWLSAFMRRVWWTYLVIGGFMIGFIVATLHMQSMAINNGVAHYNSQTGKWQWGVSTEIMISDKMPDDVLIQPKGKKNGK